MTCKWTLLKAPIDADFLTFIAHPELFFRLALIQCTLPRSLFIDPKNLHLFTFAVFCFVCKSNATWRMEYSSAMITQPHWWPAILCKVSEDQSYIFIETTLNFVLQFSFVWRLRCRRLPRPYLFILVSICSASRCDYATKNYGKS